MTERRKEKCRRVAIKEMDERQCSAVQCSGRGNRREEGRGNRREEGVKKRNKGREG